MLNIKRAKSFFGKGKSKSPKKTIAPNTTEQPAIAEDSIETESSKGTTLRSKRRIGHNTKVNTNSGLSHFSSNNVVSANDDDVKDTPENTSDATRNGVIPKFEQTLQTATEIDQILSSIDDHHNQNTTENTTDNTIVLDETINKASNIAAHTNLPNTYVVGPESDFTYFDNLIHLLNDGDTVRFEKGSHVILTSQLKVKNLTIRGVNTSDTLVDVVSDDPNALFLLEPNGELTIENITIRFAPNTRLALYDTDANIYLNNCNIHWNHYKIKDITTNLPLIAPKSPDLILNEFTAIETYIMTIDIIAKHFYLRQAGIGDDNGTTGHLTGWAEAWEHTNFHNMILSAVGTAKNMTILGKVVVADVTGALAEKMPNVSNAPFVIENLNFGRVANYTSADNLLFAPGSIKDRISRFSKALSNDQTTAIKLRKRYWDAKTLTSLQKKMHLYEFVNTKSRNALYVMFDTDTVTNDRRPIYNSGNLIVSGNTHDSKSEWSCVQGSGQLIFNHLVTDWFWSFESEEAREKSRFKPLESTWADTEKNLIKLTPTALKPSTDLPIAPIPIMQKEIRRLFESSKPFWENAMREIKFEPGTIYVISKPVVVSVDRFVAVAQKSKQPITYLSEKTVTSSSPREHIELLAARAEKTWLVTLNALNKDTADREDTDRYEQGRWARSLVKFVASPLLKLKLVVIADTPEDGEAFARTIKDPDVTVKLITL